MVDFVDAPAHVLFRVVAIIMRLAPLGAFGAMAFTVGNYGIGSLLSLGKLMATFYLTGALFVLVVLGGHRADGARASSSSCATSARRS